MQRLRAASLLLLTLAVGAGARDLGTWGNVFEPAEPDMLDFIQSRLKTMEQNGELARLKDEAIERVRRNAVRPPPVAGLSPAVKYRAFSYDPTFIVRKTLTDMKGNIIARQGDQVNPFDRVDFNQTLFFIDADNPQEVAWLKPQLAGAGDFKIILVKGNIRETSDALNERIYFDQAGVLTTKFGFEHTPARVTRDNRVLKIEEFPVTGANK